MRSVGRLPRLFGAIVRAAECKLGNDGVLVGANISYDAAGRPTNVTFLKPSGRDLGAAKRFSAACERHIESTKPLSRVATRAAPLSKTAATRQPGIAMSSLCASGDAPEPIDLAETGTDSVPPGERLAHGPVADGSTRRRLGRCRLEAHTNLNLLLDELLANDQQDATNLFPDPR